MKNIFVALALFFALGATAQVKKNPTKATPAKVTPAKEMTPFETAQKDYEALNKIVSVTNEATKVNIIKTFETKYRTLESDGLSQERKDALYSFVTSRLEELLGTEDFAKLKSNKALFAKLTK